MKTRQCLKCNCIISVRSFLKHILNEHNLSEKEYYDLYLKQSDEGLCKNCGKQTRFYSMSRGYSPCCSNSCGAQIGQKKRYENPEERKLSSERTKKYMADPAVRIKLSKMQKKRYADPEERKRISEAVRRSEVFQQKIHSNAYSNKMHEILVKRYADDKNREKMSNACKNSIKMQTALKSEKNRLRHSEIMLERAKNGGIMKRYEYDNKIFMSLPELALYIWLKQHVVEFEYQCEPLIYFKDGHEKMYIPDFNIKGRYVEIKGPQFFKENHLWDPFRKTFSYEKEKCMIENNVCILKESQYMIFVNWLYKHYGRSFINSCKIQSTVKSME